MFIYNYFLLKNILLFIDIRFKSHYSFNIWLMFDKMLNSQFIRLETIFNCSYKCLKMYHKVIHNITVNIELIIKISYITELFKCVSMS